MKDVLVYIGYNTLNYGSALQAAATGEMLRGAGFQYEILKTDSLQKEIRRNKVRFYLTSGELSFFLKSKGKWAQNKILARIKQDYRVLIQSRKKKFKEFLEKHLVFTEDVCSWEEAGSVARQFRTVLLGSDQMWLPSSVVTNTYTLHFVDESINMVSYATSFGIGSVPGKYWDCYRQMFNHIGNVSVREKSGQKIYHDIMGKDCTLVLDPVFMTDREAWAELIPVQETSIQEPYVFCYFLGNNLWQRKWAREFAEKVKMKLVGVIHCDEYIKADEQVYDISEVDLSPEAFLNRIRKASYVLTDSFHCSALSVIEEKKFGVFRRFSDKAATSTNNRIYSFLETVGLEDRLVSEDTPCHTITDEIDYVSVHQRMRKRREESLSFLKNSLELGKSV